MSDLGRVSTAIVALCLAQTAISADRLPVQERLDSWSVARTQVLVDQPGQFGRGCASILSGDLIFDQYQKLSSRYRVEQYYNWACRSEYTSAGAMKEAGLKLGIPLEGLPIPLDIGAVFSSNNFKESLTQWCSTAWSHLADQATYEEFSRVVNQGMVSAYKSCIDAEKETMLQKLGVFAYVTPQDDYLRKFVVTLEFRPPTFDYKPRITSVEGSDFTCMKDGKALKTPYNVTTRTVVLTCTKGVDDSRIVAFNTEPTGASTPVKMPGLSEGIIIDLDQRTRGLGQAIALDRKQNRQAFSALSTRTMSCRAIPAEDHQGQPGCGGGEYQLSAWCSGDCNGDDARVTLCCANPQEVLPGR